MVAGHLQQVGADRVQAAAAALQGSLASCGVPLRVSQVCRALGQGGEPRHREGMRSNLERLTGRGVAGLVEGEPGLFTLADGVAAGLDGAEVSGQRRT